MVHDLLLIPKWHYHIYVSSSFSQDSIFRIVAAILHLGNIEFTSRHETDDSAVVKGGDSRFHLETAAQLLM